MNKELWDQVQEVIGGSVRAARMEEAEAFFYSLVLPLVEKGDELTALEMDEALKRWKSENPGFGDDFGLNNVSGAILNHINNTGNLELLAVAEMIVRIEEELHNLEGEE